jgi:hypothetical protein
MPSRAGVISCLSVSTILLVVSNKRLDVLGFLLPVLLLVGALISFAYFMETRNWSVGYRTRIRRVSDSEDNLQESEDK